MARNTARIAQSKVIEMEWNTQELQAYDRNFRAVTAWMDDTRLAEK